MPVLYALPFVYVLQFLPATHGAKWHDVTDINGKPAVYTDILKCYKRGFYLEHSQNWLFFGCKQVEIER